MGRIDRLNLHNFKSYAGTVQLGPFTDFTAVIGPNGAGKSNILDAVSFVMGVKSSSLRGAALTDLIHKRSEAVDSIAEEKALPTTGAKSAYVELVYALSDNEMHLFDESERDGAHLSFKRTIQPSGSSNYQFNHRNIGWAGYNRQLSKLGVLVKGKNFLVFQGDVESIAQKTDAEFAAMIDQLSGSAALIHDYDEAKRLVEEADYQFLQLANKRKQVAKERKQLKAQKDEADAYTEKIDEMKSKKKDLYLWLFDCLCNDERAKAQEKEALLANYQSKQQLLTDIQSELDSELQTLAKKKKSMAIAEKKVSDQARSLEKKRPDQTKLTEEIKYTEKKIAKLTKELAAVRSARDEYRRTVKNLEADQAKVRERIAKLNDEERRSESESGREITLREEEKKEYLELKKSLNATITTITEEKKSLSLNIRNLQAGIDDKQLRINELKDKKRTNEATLKEQRERSDRLKDDADELTRKLNTQKKSLAEIDKTLRSRAKIVVNYQHELVTLSQTLQTMQSLKNETSKQARQRELIELLSQRFTGIHGRLSELIRPSSAQFAVAVSVAIGKHNDSIVVDSQATAIQCINYMKEQKTGTATFIPLDTIKVRPVSEHLRALGENVRLVIDVINAPDFLHRALLYVLGDTLTTTIMDDARRLAYGRGSDDEEEKRYKIIVSDGSIIHRNGNMTGGGTIETRRDTQRYDEAEFQRQSARKTEIFETLTKYESERLDEQKQRLVTEIQKLELSVTNIEGARQQAIDDAMKREFTVRDIDAKIDEIQSLIDSEKDELQSLQSQLTTVDTRIQAEEARIFADFNRRIGVTSIRHYEEGRLRLVEEYARKKNELAELEAKLSSNLAYERERDTFDSRERTINAAIKANKATLDELKQRNIAKTAEIDADKEAIIELGQQYDRAKKAVEEEEKSVESKNATVNELAAELNALSKSMGGIDAQIEILREEKKQLVKTVRVEGVQLPRRGTKRSKKGRSPAPKRRTKKRRGDNDDDESEEHSDDQDEEMEEASDGPSPDEDILAESGDPCDYLDFTSVPAELRDSSMTQTDRDAIRQRYFADIADLQNAADKLAPNMKAAEKFVEVNARAESMRGELEEAKAHVQRLQEQFQAVKDERTRLFLAAFKHSQHAIQQIYSSLTAGAELPMGGKATLTLSETEEPYAKGVYYNVMPPMKRFISMRALSGGEKTVASLALIFALHSYQPSPFFVLDEIDSALDNINVTKVANYIRARAAKDHLQIIVISLKETFYSKAQSLIGVYRDIQQSTSGILSVDLTKYD